MCCKMASVDGITCSSSSHFPGLQFVSGGGRGEDRRLGAWERDSALLRSVHQHTGPTGRQAPKEQHAGFRWPLLDATVTRKQPESTNSRPYFSLAKNYDISCR